MSPAPQTDDLEVIMYDIWQTAADEVRAVERGYGDDVAAIAAVDALALAVADADPLEDGIRDYALEFVHLYRRLRATDI